MGFTKTERKSIVERILESLKNGHAPWKSPYYMKGNARGVSGAYGAYNNFSLLLQGANYSSSLYLTFNQAKNLGGSVRKGQHGYTVLWRGIVEKKDKDGATITDENGIALTYPVLKAYTVFNVEQCEGLDSLPAESTDENKCNLEACDIIINYKNKPNINVVHSRCGSYSPQTDTVTIPPINTFVSSEEFYGCFFHELIHSTSHVSRLARKLDYAREELVAEIGATLLNGKCGLDTETYSENATSYCATWAERIKGLKDSDIFSAFSKAEKAVKYIIG